MFRLDLLRLVVAALGLSVGTAGSAQESTINTAPQTTLPTLSNERLGTGVPSRLPKVEVQRPVFTIQSGGPVALPMPQFRPTRDVTPTAPQAKEIKNSLPSIEQTRPGQNSATQNVKVGERRLSPTRPAISSTAPPAARPAASQPTWLQPQLTTGRPVEFPRTTATTGPLPLQRPLPRPTPGPVPAAETPARVLNFSIN